MGIFLKKLFHTFFNTYITHLPSFISFRGLAFEYCLYQIQTLVCPLNHRFSFFFVYRELTRKYISHFIPNLVLCISLSFTLMHTKLIEKINPFMLCMPDKFLYQNQQQTPDTLHFTLTRKSFHTSCRLQIVSTRFISNVDQ